MALRRESLDSPPDAKRALGISSRPVKWLGGLFLGLGVAGFVIVSDEPSAEATDKRKDVAPILIPDRTTAAQLAAKRAPATLPAPVHASAAAGSAVPAAPQDGLGVTPSVPLVPVDEPVGVGPLARLDEAEKVRRSLLAQDKLERLREQLELRRAAYTESSDVEAFAEARRARAQEVSDFLGGVQSDGAQGGAGDLLGVGGEGLRALSAMPAAALKLAEGARGGSPGVDGAGASEAAVSHAMKNDFFRRGGDQLPPGELGSEVKPATSPYRLLMGWKIPGVLQTAINSEGPGPISGFVREDVYDTATGRHLLIPKNSTLVGTYSSAVAQGQRRVQIAWVRLNFPNGSTLDLQGLPGTDQAGMAGFSHEVDTHWDKRLAGALLASIFAVGFEATMPKQRLSFESSLHRGVGESLTQFGIEEARRLGQQPPTLKIPAGYKFTIFATKDVTFPGPYRDRFTKSTRR